MIQLYALAEAFVEVSLRDKIKEGVKADSESAFAVSASMKSFGTNLASIGLAGTAAFGGMLAAVVAWL